MWMLRPQFFAVQGPLLMLEAEAHSILSRRGIPISGDPQEQPGRDPTSATGCHRVIWAAGPGKSLSQRRRGPLIPSTVLVAHCKPPPKHSHCKEVRPDATSSLQPNSPRVHVACRDRQLRRHDGHSGIPRRHPLRAWRSPRVGAGGCRGGAAPLPRLCSAQVRPAPAIRIRIAACDLLSRRRRSNDTHPRPESMDRSHISSPTNECHTLTTLAST